MTGSVRRIVTGATVFFAFRLIFDVCNIEAISLRAGAVRRHRMVWGVICPCRSFREGTGGSFGWLMFRAYRDDSHICILMLRSIHSSRWHALVVASHSSVVYCCHLSLRLEFQLICCAHSRAKAANGAIGEHGLLDGDITCTTFPTALRKLHYFTALSSLELYLQSAFQSPTSVAGYTALLLQYGLQTGVRGSIAAVISRAGM